MEREYLINAITFLAIAASPVYSYLPAPTLFFSIYFHTRP